MELFYCCSEGPHSLELAQHPSAGLLDTYCQVCSWGPTNKCLHVHPKSFLLFPTQHLNNAWESASCGKTEDQMALTDQARKYMAAFPTRTLVM